MLKTLSHLNSGAILLLVWASALVGTLQDAGMNRPQYTRIDYAVTFGVFSRTQVHARKNGVLCNKFCSSKKLSPHYYPYQTG